MECRCANYTIKKTVLKHQEFVRVKGGNDARNKTPLVSDLTEPPGPLPQLPCEQVYNRCLFSPEPGGGGVLVVLFTPNYL